MDYSQDTSNEAEIKKLIGFWANTETEVSLFQFLHVSKEELTAYFRGDLHAGFIIDRFIQNGGLLDSE